MCVCVIVCAYLCFYNVLQTLIFVDWIANLIFILVTKTYSSKMMFPLIQIRRSIDITINNEHSDSDRRFSKIQEIGSAHGQTRKEDQLV